ncbi:MAG: WsbD [Candidatus Amesbacteria bacterium GW2011_GWA2_47_11b]|uniref:WsbD n=3 Tax=Candidatus Amesiibacteriota TaxID=1752730 RepID=A0A0G1SI49_9BACT|nr:MAG: Glycosyl transferase family 2 [Microgenomates group bacterium GW2011_GWC1_46_20]KKU58543.1 MAG: WsbD [Candidatus Amesbacteria bacterium GW2011_GWA2_47_11b]KKU69104.1 MAG: WsbD [Candidatus Amesbacteria bacterium GW2011_GWA1_47_20]KKU83184.1 MAG: WsbD [Candidatus Amesbacteria bacterium GW2011_GWC2_47_8]
MKTLSIIILSYNVKKLLLDCLASIPKHPDWEVIVVDNASTDGSADLAAIKNPTNIGFAAGNNLGIRQAKGKYILLLNPDTIVYPKTIETVLKYMQDNPKVGAATCRVELPDGNLDYSCHRNFPDPVGSFLHLVGLRRLSKYSSTHIPNAIHEIDALTGAFAFIRRTAGDQVGWLDEDYFFNAEDIDFCYKLKEAGWKVMYLPQVKITHFKGSSAMATPVTRRLWAKHSTDAMRLFYRKHLASKYPFFINWLVYFGIWIIRLIRSIRAIR